MTKRSDLGTMFSEFWPDGGENLSNLAYIGGWRIYFKFAYLSFIMPYFSVWRFLSRVEAFCALKPLSFEVPLCTTKYEPIVTRFNRRQLSR